ncbi:hypothetical protein BpHYR1_000634 [Brachionus plicatilis]|uniref:RNA-directed DNA polymerase from mobile element jockey-like n=1 Tax=Brachionus plicatilis TaxID=10195 RepID=A0A3M7R9X2_BRAPC|nr:hypothetical protein BpHYR1_000634 [Brachionus plicatilis]
MSCLISQGYYARKYVSFDHFEHQKLIIYFNLPQWLEKVDIGLKRGNSGNRSHTFQLVREIYKKNMGRNRFLTNRTATTWNLLPSTVVNAESVNRFKAAFDNHMTAGRLRRSIYQT